MPSDKNITKVSELKEKLGKAKSVALSDYRGLNVPQMQELKRNIKAKQGELLITKNRLFKIALRQSSYKDGDELSQALTGPTAFLFCFDDEIAPIKALHDFAKENDLSADKTGLPKLKVGFLGKEFLDNNRLVSLAKLPTLPELQAKLVGVLNGPRAGLVNVLGGNIRKLVYALQAISEEKQ